jgi:hypothetical protein
MVISQVRPSEAAEVRVSSSPSVQKLCFERGRSDHQHARSFPQTVKKRTRRDCLDSLSQPHFIGQQRPFLECQVEHSVPLVRIQGHQGLMRRPFARVDLLFIFPEQELALRAQPPRLQPRPYFLRDPQVGQLQMPE